MRRRDQGAEMTDIVERLRQQADNWRKTKATMSHHLMQMRTEDEAADEIETLRARVAELKRRIGEITAERIEADRKHRECHTALSDLFGADMVWCMMMDGKADQIAAIEQAKKAIGRVE
jgi:chromosome segregation ATPase